MKKINVITLGCSKNRVDSEHLMAQLSASGHRVVFDSDSIYSKVVIINTCGFIGDAKQESIDVILNAAENKNAGRIEELYVVGCLSERYAEELKREIPEIDALYGATGWEGLIERLGSRHNPDYETVRLLSTPKHYAYLKISEGCDWRCGYCAIPLIRGRHISVPMEVLLKEAKGLISSGVKELIVVAQDTTYYGRDIYGERRLAPLLEALAQLEGLEWLRLHYAYPTDFPEEVIDVMARESKICKYLDIPLQHISDSQLSAMKRRHTKADAVALIERLRAKIPGIAIRTTMLVGYPGESEADFEELVEFVREMKFERLGVFAYSEEEGTYSATLKDDVPEEVKQQRVERLMMIQSEISLNLNLDRVGQQMRVVVDSLQGDYYLTRSEYDSPEVDQEILIPVEDGRLYRGRYYNVLVTGAEEFDLYGQVIKK